MTSPFAVVQLAKQYRIFGPHFLQLSFVNARNYGLLGLDRDEIVLQQGRYGDQASSITSIHYKMASIIS